MTSSEACRCFRSVHVEVLGRAVGSRQLTCEQRLSALRWCVFVSEARELCPDCVQGCRVQCTMSGSMQARGSTSGCAPCADMSGAPQCLIARRHMQTGPRCIPGRGQDSSAHDQAGASTQMAAALGFVLVSAANRPLCDVAAPVDTLHDHMQSAAGQLA